MAIFSQPARNILQMGSELADGIARVGGGT